MILSFILLMAATTSGPALDQQHRGAWPSVESQLASDRVIRGSELERLIRKNQDFSLLNPWEADDKIPYPPWLRVLWRKAHPKLEYSEKDPTGGYPRVLGQTLAWMVAHQDLRPVNKGASSGPGAPSQNVTSTLEQRISGTSASPRSESDIRINFWMPSEVISASNDIVHGGHQALYYSGDGGATWGQTSLSLIAGDALHSDPTVDWTSDGTAWSVTLGIDSSFTVVKLRAYKSSDGGATWTFDSTVSGSQTDTDKEMIWVDHAAGSPYKDNIYAIWDTGPVYVSRRNGPSGTWSSPFQVSGSETGAGIGADIKTNSSGDVFAFWPDYFNSLIFMVKSTNGGATYGSPVLVATTYDSYDIGIPSFADRRALIYVSAGAYRTSTKDMVYASWVDLSGNTGCTSPADEPGRTTSSTCKTRIWFARSMDGGAHWSAKVKINDQASLNDQFNQWMAVDETSGRISIIYYDTISAPGRKKTDVWYQTSADDGATWSASVKLTTAQTDETLSGADRGNQYGDYNGLTAYAGVLFPSWTDRRNNAAEEIWTTKLQECLPPVEVSGLTFTDTTTLVWDSAPSGSGTGTVYQVVRGSLAELPVGSGSSESCLDSNLAATTTTDPALPATGSGFWYLVRWRSACGTGTYGFRSDGSEITTAACP